MPPKTKRIIIMLATIVAMTFGGVFLANAQDSDPIPNQVTTKIEHLATANIYNAQLLQRNSQQGATVYFDLYNREGVQAGIIYGLLLGTNSQNEFKTVDRYVSSQEISIGQEETIPLKIEYQAPAYLKGKYDVIVFAEDKSGMIASQFPAGQINLNGNGKYIEISSDSCYLFVDDPSEKGKTYSILQGVDVSPEETLKVSCDVTNHLDQSVSARPSFENRLRHFTGAVSEAKPLTFDLVNLKAGEKKKVQLELPKALKPQAYDAMFSLKVDGNLAISNIVPLHYVLRGKSATIQALKLDKDGYNQGDTATVTFMWSGSADSFQGSRKFGGSFYGLNTDKEKYFADVSVKNKLGQSCATSSDNALDNSSKKVELKLPIKANCLNPQVSFTIKDSEGQVLAQKGYIAETKIEVINDQLSDSQKPEKQSESFFKRIGTLLVKILIIALTLLAILLIVFKWKKQRQVLPIFFLFVLSGLFVAGLNQARADTWSVANFYPAPKCLNDPICWESDGANVLKCDCYHVCVLGETIPGFTGDCSPTIRTSQQTFHAWLNKLRYNQGETIAVSGGASVNENCYNMPMGIKHLSLFDYQDDKKATVFDKEIPWEQRMTDSVWGTDWSFKTTTNPDPDPYHLYSIGMEGCFQGWLRDPAIPGSPAYPPYTPVACNTDTVYPNVGAKIPLYYMVNSHPDGPENLHVVIDGKNSMDDFPWAFNGTGSFQINVDGKYEMTHRVSGEWQHTIPHNFVKKPAPSARISFVDGGDMRNEGGEKYRLYDVRYEHDGIAEQIMDSGLEISNGADVWTIRLIYLKESVSIGEQFKICPADTTILYKGRSSFLNAYYWPNYPGTGNFCDNLSSAIKVTACPQDCENTPYQTLIPKTNWSLVSTDSQETRGENGRATNAFDDNSATIWHTRWSDASPGQPHEIIIDLSTSYDLSGFKYLPRQDGVNGTIKDYEFYVSPDNVAWTIVSSGSFASGQTEKIISFDKTNARYIKLRSLSEVNNGPWTSVAEISLIGSNTTTISSPCNWTSDNPGVVKIDGIPSRDGQKITGVDVTEQTNVRATFTSPLGTPLSDTAKVKVLPGETCMYNKCNDEGTCKQITQAAPCPPLDECSPPETPCTPVTSNKTWKEVAP